MSEMPERKVLKEVLANLKSKSLGSNEERKMNVASIMKELYDAMQLLTEQIEKDPTDPMKLLRMNIMQRVQLLIDKVISSSDNAMKDMEIYIDALERYSTNLDETLAKIFEQARRMAEKQIKQQEEKMKRKSPESYRV